MERPKYVFCPRGKSLPLGERTRIMGVVNITPDSFSDGGQFLAPDLAVRRCVELLAAGADMLDLGGESSRPGAKPISPSQELERVAPVLERIRAQTGAIISIDTCKAEVAAECLRLGADVINDITALRNAPDVSSLVAAFKAGIVLMHMRGTPDTMQTLPPSPDIIADMNCALSQAVGRARAAGIGDDCILVDPGIGFGKTAEDNLRILNRLPLLNDLGFPILVGPSRKSFLGRVTNRAVDARTLASAAAAVIAAIRGAHIVRVHDVTEVREVLVVTDSVLAERPI
jgi:dihydropteroate synthase